MNTVQLMNFQDEERKWTQKLVQCVLKERQLYPLKSLNLECFKPKSFNCQIAADCKICIKSHKSDLCKVPRNHGVSN